MSTLFIQIRFLDVIDVLLVAVILYQLYILIRGTGGMHIFLGILSIYLLWWLVRIFEMDLLAAILGQFVSVGVLALIIVFQPEIRKFLLFLGTRSILKKFLHFQQGEKLNIAPILNACEYFSYHRTGALIVITGVNELDYFLETGQRIEAILSDQLLETIFYKNNPLHDGAVIISGNKIMAARCVLPVSDNETIPVTLGLRHRAAAGITEQTDAVALVVSEQTGKISWVKQGHIQRNIKPVHLKELLAREFATV